MHAGEQVRVDNVSSLGVDDHVLVAFDRIGFVTRDECRPDITEIGAHGLGSGNSIAGRNRAGQGQRPIEELTDFLDQGKG